jgi:hypothetical protein
MGFCASTIPIFDFIQARATVFASRRLVHYCHSPTIFGPNAEICRSYRVFLQRIGPATVWVTGLILSSSFTFL